MANWNRRQFARSVGAGLVLAPFLSLRPRIRRAHAAAGGAKRLVLFCTMGTQPELWTPTALSGETITTFSRSTEPLAAIKDSLVLVEGLPSGNPNDNHGSPDGLTGLGNGYYPIPGAPPGKSQLKISVDQYVADRLVAAGINRPIRSLLLGGDTNNGGGLTMFYGGDRNGGNNLPTIGSPLSAFTTVFGGALPTGLSAADLLRRRRSILDLVKGEIGSVKSTLGARETAKMNAHLDSIRELENKLAQTVPPGGGCMKPPMPGADSTFNYMNGVDGIKTNAVHLDIIANALACDITRVAAIEFGNDGKFMVNLPGRLPYDDQHGGFIHSGASSGYKNLIEFERYLSEQFVALVNKLKGLQDPEDPTKNLFQTTLVVWCRDMGNADKHTQESMRFVLAQGSGGYLKTAAGGRYLKSTQRHERVLLNICEAMGFTTFAGFGDPGLGASKLPLPGIGA